MEEYNKIVIPSRELSEPVRVVDVKPIFMELDRLGQVVFELDKLVAELEGRLEPAMKEPEPEKSGVDGTGSSSNTQSALSVRIRAVGMDVEKILQKVSSIHRRLEM